ncbi:MAG: tetratricopeptide repeat protein, partial [Planctomycetaceae bacterium]
MGDYEPASSARQASADRMLAIAQVFEQQGKLDKAESMYRGALKKNPQSTAIRQHLADGQAKRRAGGAGTAV